MLPSSHVIMILCNMIWLVGVDLGGVAEIRGGDPYSERVGSPRSIRSED